MPSGWGEEDASGSWYATRDFTLKTLTVRAGSRLPDGWQIIQNVKYLQQMYGKDCVVRKTQQAILAEMSGAGQEHGDPHIDFSAPRRGRPPKIQ